MVARPACAAAASAVRASIAFMPATTASHALAISVLALSAQTEEETNRGLAVVAGMNAIDALTALAAAAQAGRATTLRAVASSLAYGAAALVVRSMRG